MLTTIYYYSATGNSLALARAIAGQLEDSEIQPLSLSRRERTTPSSARVGIIFPIHAWGPPRTVSEFIENLDLSGARYVFAIASCGGTAAGTLPLLRKAIRKQGGDLHAGFIVRSPGYMDSGGDDPPMIATVRRFSGKLFPTAEERLPEIIETVRNEKKMDPEHNALLGSILGNFFHTKAVVAFAGMDAAYCVTDNCAGCGNCTRICPRGNVSLQEGKPVWHHDCENCGACATWCARNAIALKGAAAAPRKHNPQIAAADLMHA